MKIFGVDPNSQQWRKGLLQRSTFESKWIFIPVGYSMVNTPGEWTRQNNLQIYLHLTFAAFVFKKDMIPGTQIIPLLYSKLINAFPHAHSNALPFSLFWISLFISFFEAKAKASYLAYKYGEVGRCLQCNIKPNLVLPCVQAAFSKPKSPFSAYHKKCENNS